MINVDELMRNASEEQRKYLRELKSLRQEEKRLIEQEKRAYDREHRSYDVVDREPPMDDKSARGYLNSATSAQGREFRELQGRIEKVVKNANKVGILIVPSDSLN